VEFERTFQLFIPLVFEWLCEGTTGSHQAEGEPNNGHSQILKDSLAAAGGIGLAAGHP
jgi:hypothetical protein